ncbi:hypothetical protein [Lachnoclostridium sp. Marseille-P6806]|uniref:hypothetical protein n=1 Tax=Lachnoclostridium sp. Marseille-P6806 TaxID=2364793 RepID=UPI0013EEED38|nr:hypothetical protein [Lachnoclostridium sp. Marseille-P6806]
MKASRRGRQTSYFRVLDRGQKNWCFYIILQLPSPKTDVIVLLSLDCRFENPDVNISP